MFGMVFVKSTVSGSKLLGAAFIGSIEKMEKVQLLSPIFSMVLVNKWNKWEEIGYL